VNWPAAPERMESSKAWFTGSARLVVFSTDRNERYCKLNRVSQLTADSTIFNSEQLSLVVASDSRVGVDIARQHGQVLGEILRLHVLFLNALSLTREISDFLLIYIYITI